MYVLILWFCALCVIFMILVSLENVTKCVLGDCTVTVPFEKISNIEANSALSHENETKIVKITHSVVARYRSFKTGSF